MIRLVPVNRVTEVGSCYRLCYQCSCCFLINVACLVVVVVLVVRLSSASQSASCLDVILGYCLLSAY